MTDFRITRALLDHFKHPNSDKCLRFLYFAIWRARHVVTPTAISPEAVAWWIRVSGMGC